MKSTDLPLPSSRWASLRWLQWDALSVLFLLGLGLFHIPMQWVSDLPLGDPTSFRKPILFGISTGLTLGSLLLLLADLRPRGWDSQLRGWLCGTLVVEVLLITVQSWRHVPSHFNRSTFFDATMEISMLACILVAVVLIVGLTVRSLQRNAFHNTSPARILAQRAGMIFLVLSCVLGIGITVLGNYLMLRGGSSEIFGAKGVLKFPHGAVLHAIQTLVLWAWLCDRSGSARGHLSVAWLAASHLFFLSYSVRQTLLGIGRWDVEGLGWGLLGGAIASAFVSLMVAIWPRR